jgi:hypothetical protein
MGRKQKTLRRVADESVAAKHTHAGIPMSPARSQVQARGKIIDRNGASVRGDDLKDVLGLVYRKRRRRFSFV